MLQHRWFLSGLIIASISLASAATWLVLAKRATLERRSPLASVPPTTAVLTSPQASEVPLPPTSPPTLSPIATMPPTTPAISAEAFTRQVSYPSGSLTLVGTLCKPAGIGPFAATSYHHGGKEGQIGGAPEETCAALAQAGFVGFAPIRRTDLDFQGNLTDVQAGIDYLKTLAYVDPNRLAVVGFSRGGLLAFMATTSRSDLQALVILAPAPSQGDTSLDELAKKVTTPVLIQVASNDLPSKLNGGENLVDQAKAYERALRTAGKEVELQIQPPYQGKNDGHLLFFSIGDYWSGVIEFLEGEL